MGCAQSQNILKKLLQEHCQRVVDLRLAAAKTSHELEHAPGRRSSLESQSRWLKLFDFYERAHKGNLSFNGKISIGVPNLFNYYWDIAIIFLSISSHHRFQPSHLACPYPYPFVKGHYPKSKGNYKWMLLYIMRHILYEVNKAYCIEGIKDSRWVIVFKNGKKKTSGRRSFFYKKKNTMPKLS